MPSLTITLIPGQKAFIDEQVKSRNLASTSEFLSQLILIEQLKPQKRKIDALVLDGLHSGPTTPMTKQDWQEIEQAGMQRLTEEKKNLARGPAY